MKKKDRVTDSSGERRNHPRLEAKGYCQIDQKKLRNKIIDISLGGVRILTSKEFEGGEELKIKLFLQKGFQFETKACVVWIMKRPSGSKNKAEIGFKFLDLPLDILCRLEEYLQEQPA